MNPFDHLQLACFAAYLGYTLTYDQPIRRYHLTLTSILTNVPEMQSVTFSNCQTWEDAVQKGIDWARQREHEGRFR